MPGVLRQLALQPEIDRLLASSSSSAVAAGMALASRDSAAEAKSTLWGQLQRWQARRKGRPEWQARHSLLFGCRLLLPSLHSSLSWAACFPR